MTFTSSIQRAARQPRREVATHLFAVGQSVKLKDGFARHALAADIYCITATMPPRGDSLQYRIRNDDERYERVTTEDNLEPVDTTAGSGTTLIQRTFGNGQGTETQQSRDQKTKAGESGAQA